MGTKKEQRAHSYSHTYQPRFALNRMPFGMPMFRPRNVLPMRMERIPPRPPRMVPKPPSGFFMRDKIPFTQTMPVPRRPMPYHMPHGPHGPMPIPPMPFHMPHGPRFMPHGPMPPMPFSRPYRPVPPPMPHGPMFYNVPHGPAPRHFPKETLHYYHRPVPPSFPRRPIHRLVPRHYMKRKEE